MSKIYLIPTASSSRGSEHDSEPRPKEAVLAHWHGYFVTSPYRASCQLPSGRQLAPELLDAGAREILDAVHGAP